MVRQFSDVDTAEERSSTTLWTAHTSRCAEEIAVRHQSSCRGRVRVGEGVPSHRAPRYSGQRDLQDHSDARYSRSLWSRRRATSTPRLVPLLPRCTAHTTLSPTHDARNSLRRLPHNQPARPLQTRDHREANAGLLIAFRPARSQSPGVHSFPLIHSLPTNNYNSIDWTPALAEAHTSAHLLLPSLQHMFREPVQVATDTLEASPPPLPPPPTWPGFRL
ncbi:hypothetical protein AA0113_g11897 [Alternaria arborescens]|uniref:Uncharacterized protein n=1 Tax=Alternaria arborescens TaxID=156630 RepID=A0A4Q4Q126_9PLEO|nr:hypothetical protein AA0113_g11897 [Alternaria arborescens]